jgi:hypothetical protein
MQIISQKTLKDTMYYRDIPVFSYEIQYPVFTTTCSTHAAQSVNRYYADASRKKEEYCRTVLYPQAMENAKYIPDNQPPFAAYQFLSLFTVTFNSCCITSLFQDDYTFLGGAHGTTQRTSDTWNFFTGSRLQLKDFYPSGNRFPEQLLNAIEQQIRERIKEEPSSYFDTYPALLRDTFHAESYYLKPGGTVIYYQQYDIAPYATGIPEFYLPFAG